MEEEALKTSYEWCVEANVRLADLNEWPLEWHGSKERHYFELFTMSKPEFLEALSKCRVIPNSQPRKTEKYLEYRMYGLVPYNISPIQQGIQFCHAVVEYGLMANLPSHGEFKTLYDIWAKKHKTIIILNGGTTNTSLEYVGSLNTHLAKFKEVGITTASFHEQDLGDQLTSFVFLVDERVFNRTLYPDFNPETLPWQGRKPSEKQLAELESRNTENYKHWVEKIGGEKNAFLREYLKQFRLA